MINSITKLTNWYHNITFFNKNVLLFLVSIFCLLVIGCHITTDISDNAKLWGGYENKKEYILLMDVFLEKNKNRNGELTLVPPDSQNGETGGKRIMVSPNTVEEYKRDPKGSVIKYYGETKIVIDVVGVVDAGTIIRCSSLKKVSECSIWWGCGNVLLMYGEIINGPYSGKIVHIGDLSVPYQENPNEKDSMILHRPDKYFLKKKE